MNNEKILVNRYRFFVYEPDMQEFLDDSVLNDYHNVFRQYINNLIDDSIATQINMQIYWTLKNDRYEIAKEIEIQNNIAQKT